MAQLEKHSLGERTCPICSGIYQPVRSSKQTCSPRCASALYYRNHRKEITERSAENQKFARSINSISKPPKICQICSASYIPKRADQQYCGETCYHKAYRNINRLKRSNKSRE